MRHLFQRLPDPSLSHLLPDSVKASFSEQFTPNNRIRVGPNQVVKFGPDGKPVVQ